MTSSTRRTPSPRPTPNWQSSSGCTAPGAPRRRSRTTRRTRAEAEAQLAEAQLTGGGHRTWVQRMGEVFAGRYELVDPIGRGGVGAVWRAWDHRRRRYVAAKVLQQSDAHTLLRFVREQALRIDHPHVLAPASWAADDDQVLFTMELVCGGSLAQVIGDYGPLPATVRLHAARPTAGRACCRPCGRRRTPRHQACEHSDGSHRGRAAASAAVRLRHLDAQGRAPPH